MKASEQSASFDAYVRENQLGLIRYASLLAGSVAQGEDLVQEVLARLYPRWETLADAHPYVRRSITNEFLSWKRRWSTRSLFFTDEQALIDRSVDPWQDGADPTLWVVVQELPKQQRAAVVLRYYEGLTDAEIGEVLGCRPATVRGHISRGLRTLRTTLLTTEQEPGHGR